MEPPRLLPPLQHLLSPPLPPRRPRHPYILLSHSLHSLLSSSSTIPLPPTPSALASPNPIATFVASSPLSWSYNLFVGIIWSYDQPQGTLKLAFATRLESEVEKALDILWLWGYEEWDSGNNRGKLIVPD
ncbi:hypothetical protein TEA_027861 [Camellia sinensis var. sinensis]|uniref:Uncharacterized protein n=1 Tax=Camellia sinensis var. sinensis TaxID=542762 RepID=A0A4S4D9F4_CAMSN|nr:hypothetical protein TEA_027861 [Camellia sinensis var. sinensis]